MGKALKLGICVIALAAVPTGEALARHHATRCATSSEMTAIAATSIQQELMVAALTCNQIANFNAFQTSFGPELRTSDRDLMHMFVRLYGNGRGTSEYHGFKTRLANNSEMRSIHGNADFCAATTLVFAAALAPNKPRLEDFVSGVQVVDASPVDSCQMQVAMGLQGVMAAPNIVPRPKPAQFQDLTLTTSAAPAAAQATPAVAGATATPVNATAAAATTTPASGTATATAAGQASPPTTDQPKKKSGWLSGLFN